MALDLLQVEAKFSTLWLVPVSGTAAAFIGKLVSMGVHCLLEISVARNSCKWRLKYYISHFANAH